MPTGIAANGAEEPARKVGHQPLTSSESALELITFVKVGAFFSRSLKGPFCNELWKWK